MKNFKIPRFFWVKVSYRPLNNDEDAVAKILEHAAADGEARLQVSVQTVVVAGRGKFSACAVVCASGDTTEHWRNELNIAVKRGFVNSPQFVYSGNPNMLTLKLPKEYDMGANRNALYALAANTLRSWSVGIAREMEAYLFFQETKELSCEDEWLHVVGVRYATAKEDTEKGWDIVLAVSTADGKRDVHLQVVGGYQDGKEYGTVGLVRCTSDASPPSIEKVATFLLNLWRGEKKQEISLPL